MAIRSFSVGPIPGVQSAVAVDLPDLTVIVGPNGSGKSRLLYEVWRQAQRGSLDEPGTRALYMSPNRPWRRTVLPAASLYGMPMGYRQSMEAETPINFQYAAPQGYVFTGQARSPDTTDDSQVLVKFSIVKMETKRQRLISQVYDTSGGRIDPGAVPDIFEPLRELVSTLLPHMEFIGVDPANDEDQRCVFRKLDTPDPIDLDIDDLSSGEKAVIQLFLPFIESQAEQLLAATTGTPTEGPMPTAIIDEPELHLHPSLQTALVAYMRTITNRGDAQFIVATHSTTMMDALEDDELYLLAPPASVGSGSQLRRLSSSSERLEVVREITGSTHVVTRCRPIVFLEGARPDARAVSDQRVVELLVPEATSWVLVPAQGRSQATSAAVTLRDPTLTELPGIPVFALVDEDQGYPDEHDYIVSWPVCMIENLLLDPTCIWRFLSAHREKTDITSEADVQRVLAAYIEERVDMEVRLRVLRRIAQPRLNYRVTSSAELNGLPEAAAAMAAQYTATVGGADALDAARATAEADVAAILEAGTALDKFHGKDLLKRFYDEHVQRAGFAYTGFTYELAKVVAGSERAARLLSGATRRIREYVSAGLATAIADSVPAIEPSWLEHVAETVALATAARTCWEDGTPDETDRRDLRRRVLEISRVVHDAGRPDLHETMMAELVQLGDGSPPAT